MSAAESQAGPHRYLLLAAVSLGALLAPLNSTMLAVALPDIRADFSLSHAELGWLISAYLIAMAVAQPAGGRLGDQLGRARVFRTALLAFLVLSIGAAAAPNFALLVALRTGQAVAGAAMVPNGMAMLRASVAVRELGRMNGLNAAVMSISAAGGPLLGAALLAAGSWRLLFLINVPVVGVALLLQGYLHDRGAVARSRASLDWVGALLFVALLAGVTLLLGWMRGGQGAATTAAAAVVVGALAVAFAMRQRTTAAPAAAWRLFRDRSFAAATSHVLLTNLVMYTTLLTVPFFIREVQHQGSATSGLLLGAMSVLMAAVAPLGGMASDAVGRRWPAMAGAVIAAGAGLLILAGLDASTSSLYLAAALALLGVGVGLGVGSATTAALEAAPLALAGAAAGTNSMMRYIGSIVGAGILAGVLNTGEAAPGVGVFRVVIIVVVVIAGMAIVAASMIQSFPDEVRRTVDARGREAATP